MSTNSYSKSDDPENEPSNASIKQLKLGAPRKSNPRNRQPKGSMGLLVLSETISSQKLQSVADYDSSDQSKDAVSDDISESSSNLIMAQEKIVKKVFKTANKVEVKRPNM